MSDFNLRIAKNHPSLLNEDKWLEKKEKKVERKFIEQEHFSKNTQMVFFVFSKLFSSTIFINMNHTAFLCLKTVFVNGF